MTETSYSKKTREIETLKVSQKNLTKEIDKLNDELQELKKSLKIKEDYIKFITDKFEKIRILTY